MPDRAIIALLPAASLGFICGIIAAALQLGSGATLAVAIAGIVATALAATSSVFGCKGDTGERAIVGILRMGCAIFIFIGIYLFMLGFLRDGQGALALLWLVMAGIFGLLLSRLRVRTRDSSDTGDTATA